MRNRQQVRYLWLDGERLNWPDATVHVTAIADSGRMTVFEGIRAYWNRAREQLYVFRIDEHMRRFANSMKLVWMEARFSPSELAEALLQLLRANNAREDSYVRPMAFYDAGGFSFVRPPEQETRILLDSTPLESHLGASKSIGCCVSSWTRLADNVMPPRVKLGANYQNNRLAAREAQTNGYDDAIILTSQGKVSEATGACIFLIRDGTPITPTVTSGILESITRATLIRLFREQLGMDVIERDVDRTELYIADEVFCCGTGQEVTAITSIDRYPIAAGEVGPITKEIESLYNRVVRGEHPEYMDWCFPVWG